MTVRLVPLVVLLVPLLVPVVVTSERCPGADLACPYTCCRTDSERRPFICCPYRDGVCCADGRHCCRKGFTCDLTSGRCVRTAPEPGLCPDGKSRCQPDQTCCRMPKHRWGCCPYKNAVCCSDMIHCCPQGTTCDLELLICVPNTRHLMLQLAGTAGHVTELAGRPMEPSAGHGGLEA